MGNSGIGVSRGGWIYTGFLLVLAVGFATRCTPVVREYRNLKSRDYKGSAATRTQPVYRGDSLRNIRFPSGGIGAGSMLTGGRGNLLSILAPAFRADLSRCVFILHARDAEGPASFGDEKFPPALKIMEGRLFPDQAGTGLQGVPYPGIPRFSRCSFQARFPFGRWELADRHVPVKAELEIFSPFVPLDRYNSSFPAAVLHWRLRNPLDRPVELFLVFRFEDPFLQGLTGEGQDSAPTRILRINAGELRGIGFSSSGRKGRGPVRRLVILSLPEAELALSPSDTVPGQARLAG